MKYEVIRNRFFVGPDKYMDSDAARRPQTKDRFVKRNSSELGIRPAVFIRGHNLDNIAQDDFNFPNSARFVFTLLDKPSLHLAEDSRAGLLERLSYESRLRVLPTDIRDALNWAFAVTSLLPWDSNETLDLVTPTLDELRSYTRARISQDSRLGEAMEYFKDKNRIVESAIAEATKN